jgi:hypothetical protein
VTGAELLAASATILLAVVIAVSYLGDAAGLGIMPAESAIAGALAATALLLVWGRRVRWARDAALWGGVVATVCAFLLWLAWPSLLPPGSGPDLTHHLLLVDYIERHGRLVHDASAAAFLGEMAHYTPGVHLLAVIAGAVTRTDGFHAIYPVVAAAVALKAGVLFVILLRLLSRSAVREPLAVCGVLFVVALSDFSINSFVHDSFLAQAVAELFAVALWWVMTWWDEQPGGLAMVLFAIVGVAVFLTWPVWIGPPVLTFGALMLMRRDMSRRRKMRHLSLALAPIAVVAIIHTIGRASWVGIVGTSGAVLLPSPATVGTWLPLLAFVGLVSATGDWRSRTLLVFSAAIIVQAAALWVVAEASGADTPYMAIKMTYLAIYPAIAAATIALAKGWNLLARLARPGSVLAGERIRQIIWAAILVLAVLVSWDAAARRKTTPVVSDDLWQAGRWARQNVPPSCVDYLVRNEYTAYWLHLAVLGNARATERTADNDTFLTEPSFARWIVPGGLPYAIANLTILPSEIRSDVDVLYQTGSAAVVKRRGADICN